MKVKLTSMTIFRYKQTKSKDTLTDILADTKILRNLRRKGLQAAAKQGRVVVAVGWLNNLQLTGWVWGGEGGRLQLTGYRDGGGTISMEHHYPFCSLDFFFFFFWGGGEGKEERAVKSERKMVESCQMLKESHS